MVFWARTGGHALYSQYLEAQGTYNWVKTLLISQLNAPYPRSRAQFFQSAEATRISVEEPRVVFDSIAKLLRWMAQTAGTLRAIDTHGLQHCVHARLLQKPTNCEDINVRHGRAASAQEAHAPQLTLRVSDSSFALIVASKHAASTDASRNRTLPRLAAMDVPVL